MRSLLSVLVILVALAFAGCKNGNSNGLFGSVDTSKVAILTIDSPDTLNLGVVKEGDLLKHTYKIKNTGNADLIIHRISTSCGCTAPSYSKKPIAPGETGSIEIQFNSKGKGGVQMKSFTIHSNARVSQKIIHFTVEVTK
jgi:hypothetical protein